jgi:hypothetical protein
MSRSHMYLVVQTTLYILALENPFSLNMERNKEKYCIHAPVLINMIIISLSAGIIKESKVTRPADASITDTDNTWIFGLMT